VATTRLCLIRHGETDWNAAGRLQGWTDIALNSTGLLQAEATAQILADVHFDALYCSDLQRARMTAEIINRHHQLPLNMDSRLRERNLGLLQGLHPHEAQAQFPEIYARLRARFPDYQPVQGEDVIGFAARIRAALADLLLQHCGETLLLVAHGGVLDIIYRIASGIPFSDVRDWRLRNGALNWLEHDGERWRIVAWDQVAHLESAKDEKAV
jgi:probable phosphoglycerate mutase